MLGTAFEFDSSYVITPLDAQQAQEALYNYRLYAASEVRVVNSRSTSSELRPRERQALRKIFSPSFLEYGYFRN